MNDQAIKQFPNYLEMKAVIPKTVWHIGRIAGLVGVAVIVWLLMFYPEIGFKLFWGLLIPVLPAVFAFMPGFWRQVCPMALFNQIPRIFGFSLEKTLPVKWKNMVYIFSVLAFFFLVSLRHVFFNNEPAALIGLIVISMSLAFIGGVIFKGRSGWCGTFCPIAPIQKSYGQAPVVIVRNGYCDTCLGCQKNCYDFNPKAAIHSDLNDPDPWYAGHKKLFIAGLPGFAIGFFNAVDPSETGLLSYFMYMGVWIVTTLGIYEALTILLRVNTYTVTAVFSMSAIMIFYWYALPLILSTVEFLFHISLPGWAFWLAYSGIAAIVLQVLVNGHKAQTAYLEMTQENTTPPKTEANIDALRAGGVEDTNELVVDRASGRSFAANTGHTLLESIESSGLTIDFGCRMGMCGADAIAIVDGMDNLSPPSDEELATLRRLGLEGRARMACVCKALKGDVTIDLKMNPNDLPEPPPPENKVDYGIEAGVSKVVIIGNGAAGMAAADSVRRLSPSCEIHVIAKESHPFYNRMAIGRLIHGRTGADDLYLMSSDWCEIRNIGLSLNTIVTKVNRQEKTVALGTGENISYDKLIMAQGASAFMPPATGSDLPGCYVLRNAEDALKIRSWRQLENCKHAVVLGGGVLGIEAADALRQLNLQVTIVHRSNKGLMDRNLDEKGSSLLGYYLESIGIKVVLGHGVEEILGDEKVTGVRLGSGEEIECEIYLACVGVKANIDLAVDSKLDVNRGVIVNNNMQTSDPNIYAVGDVAELPGSISGLWAVSTSQAEIASASLFDQESPYTPPNTLVSLKMDGIDVKGYGLTSPDSDSQEMIHIAEEHIHQHRMIIADGGLIVGAVFVGPPGTGANIATVIQNSSDVSPIIDQLRQGNWDTLKTIS